MRTEELRKEPRSVFDEYVETFKREGFPFTMFGKNAGKRGMLFDLTFAGECSLFRKIGERILLCFMPPGSSKEKEMMKLSDGLRAVVDSSTQTSEDITIRIEPALIDEFEMILKRKGYPVTRCNGENRPTALVYCVLHKGTIQNVAMVEEKDGSVTAFVVYPIDCSNMPVDLVYQIAGGMQETMNLGLGSVTCNPEIGEVHYVHRFHRKQFYPYEDLAEQIISLFEEEVEIALDVFKETAKKYGL